MLQDLSGAAGKGQRPGTAYSRLCRVMIRFSIVNYIFSGGNLMAKAAVVFWSGTGNTEAMANAVADGAIMAADFVICNDAPDDEAVAACEALGAALK